jgi:toxin ParE1/3/4
MKKRLIWNKKAQKDLEEIFSYISRDDAAAALRIVRRIYDAAETLAENPFIGREGLVPGTREFSIPKLPYLLPYRVKHDAVRILRVYHGARMPPSKW